MSDNLSLRSEMLTVPFHVSGRDAALIAFMLHFKELGVERVFAIQESSPNLTLELKDGRMVKADLVFKESDFEASVDSCDMLIAWMRDWRENPLRDNTLILSQHIHTEGMSDYLVPNWKHKVAKYDDKIWVYRKGRLVETYRRLTGDETKEMIIQFKADKWNQAVSKKEELGVKYWDDFIAQLINHSESQDSKAAVLDRIDPDGKLLELQKESKQSYSWAASLIENTIGGVKMLRRAAGRVAERYVEAAADFVEDDDEDEEEVTELTDPEKLQMKEEGEEDAR